MKLKKEICKEFAICITAIITLLSTPTVFGQITRPIEQGSSLSEGVRFNDGSFERAEKFFFGELYDKCLIEIKNTKTEHLDSYQQTVIKFYEGVCNAYVLKKECSVIIENFIKISSNAIYNNIARAILAQEYLKKGHYALAEKHFKNVNIPFLPKVMQARCNFYYGILFFETGQYSEAKYRFIKSSVRNDIYDNDITYYLSYVKYVEGDYEGALAGFEELIKLPKYADSAVYIAQIKFQLKDYNYIIERIDNFHRMATGGSLAELYRVAGESYYNLHQYVDAIKWLKVYQEHGGTLNFTLNYILGYSYYMEHDYKNSISHFVRIIDGENEMIQNAYYHLADSYLKIGDKKGALIAFSMAASTGLDYDISHDALYNQVKLSYEIGPTGVYTELIELINRFITKYPDSNHTNEVNGYLINLYINSSDYDRTIKAIESTHNPNDEIITALQRMSYEKGLEYFKDQNYVDAIYCFKKTRFYSASLEYVDLAEYWTAEALYKMGEEPAKIIDSYKSFIKSTKQNIPEHVFAHYNIGYIYFNDKKWDEASYWFQKFISMHKTNDTYYSDVMNRMGDIHFSKGKYGDAIQSYSISKRIEPTNIDYSDYQIALSWGLENKQSQKIDQLKQIIKENKSIYKELAMIELASSYNIWGKHKECEILLSDYILNNINSPYYPIALQELGVATSNQGKYDEALGYYKSLSEQYPTSQEAADALLAIKSIYVSQGKVSAYFDFMKSIGRDGNIDTNQRQRLSFESLQSLYLSDNYNKTINLAELFISNYPSSPQVADATFYLAESLLKKKSVTRAIEVYEQVLDLPHSQYTVSSLITLDRLYTNSNNAIKRFETNEQLFKYATDEITKQRSAETMITLALKEENAALILVAYNHIIKYPDASKKSKSLANFAKAKVSFNEKNYVESWNYIKKVKLPLSTVEGAETEYMKASIFFSERKYEDAETVVMKCINTGTPHQYWMAKWFILLGDIYAANDNLFQAKATYQSIVDGYTSSNSEGDNIIEIAQEKISNIKETPEDNN